MCVSLGHIVLVLLAFVVLGIGFSVRSQAIGWENVTTTYFGCLSSCLYQDGPGANSIEGFLIRLFFHTCVLAAWRSANGVGRINEVTLRRARLVLGWVMCPGSIPGGGTLFRYVTSHAG